MKRILSLALAVMLAAALLPAGALAEDFPATYYGADINATGLSAGGTFTVTFGISDYTELASAEFCVYYPEQYVTPIAYTALLGSSSSKAFGDDETEAVYCGCELTTFDPQGRACSYVTVSVDRVGAFENEPVLGNDIVAITYRIDSLPYTDSLPMDDAGAFIELEIGVRKSEYYNGEEDVIMDDEGNYSVTYLTSPHEPVSCVSPRVYMPLAPIPWPVFIPEVSYIGETVDAGWIAVGDTFSWTLAISEGSCLWAGMWLVDYPEEYLEPVADSVSWSGGIMAQISESIDNGAQTSDAPVFVCNREYEGQTGGNPQGEAGNMYSLVGMYLSSFGFNGLQAGGDFVRIEYRVIAMPDTEACGLDDMGYYFELPVTVVQSACWLPGFAIESPYSTSHIAMHEEVYVTDGRVYFDPGANTVSFYGFDGELIGVVTLPTGQQAEAPDAPQTVEQNGVTYVFMGWDGDVEAPVEQDAEFHAIYRAVGDIDGDGELTFTDISSLYSYALGTSAMDLPEIIGDVNGDGEISFADIGSLYALIIG